MTRVQAIVARDERVLLVKHCQAGKAWWCLPGGGQEPGETPAQGVLRELREECNVDGVIVRQTAVVRLAPEDETITYLVDIGDQVPSLGHDPEFASGNQILADLQWLQLRELSERDRAFLWAAGLLGVGGFFAEVEQWGENTSYPGEESTNP